MKFFVIKNTGDTWEFGLFDEAARFVEENKLVVNDVAVYTVKDEMDELVFVS